MDTIEFHPIGTIHTPFKDPKGAPIQPRRSGGSKGTIVIHDKFVDGLKDLDGFSHIVLLFYFHRSEGYKLRVIPFLDDVERGLFATRAPRRPNQIGLSVVQLERIEGNILHIKNVDMLDGTPLLDIKPYVHAFDNEESVRIGWLENKSHIAKNTRADKRFEE